MHLLLIGLGYSGTEIARLAGRSMRVTATIRRPQPIPPGVETLPFGQAASAIAQATHLVTTAGPNDAGDPVLATHAPAIQAAIAAGTLRYIGYCSTTGVYGDRQGGTVTEDTEPAPTAPRSHRRLAAEQAWRAAASTIALDLFRLAGIYGPGRSAIDDLREGTARSILAPDHRFSRIHVEDIAGAVLAAMNHPAGHRVLNLSDSEPAPSADVIAYAAHLLNFPAPLARPLAEAWPAMSPMARSFWAERRLVRSDATQAALNRPWLYPTYRDGLRAILAAHPVTPNLA